MGYGDEIMATGFARAARESLPRPPGWKVGFGDGREIKWGPWCDEMFAHNPYIARPGEHVSQWIRHYKGNRLYNQQSVDKSRWQWNYDIRVTPGEFFWNEMESKLIESYKRSLGDFVVIEPNVPWQKSVAPNKDWGEDKFKQLTFSLRNEGIRVVQFLHKNSRRKLPDVNTIQLQRFRDVIATLSLAKLYIGPEGGMHHAAAAVGIPAVVLMGGFIPPQVVGYDNHTNLTGGTEACGSINPCEHCRKAMERISVDEVYVASMAALMQQKRLSA